MSNIASSMANMAEMHDSATPADIKAQCPVVRDDISQSQDVSAKRQNLSNIFTIVSY